MNDAHLDLLEVAGHIVQTKGANAKSLSGLWALLNDPEASKALVNLTADGSILLQRILAAFKGQTAAPATA